jgi:hypothetical protein
LRLEFSPWRLESSAISSQLVHGPSRAGAKAFLHFRSPFCFFVCFLSFTRIPSLFLLFVYHVMRFPCYNWKKIAKTPTSLPSLFLNFVL